MFSSQASLVKLSDKQQNLLKQIVRRSRTSASQELDEPN
jgi:hypothetical protein